MTRPASPPAHDTARLIHAALAAAPVFFAVAVGFVISARPLPSAGLGTAQFALAGGAVAILAAATVLGRRIPPIRTGEALAAYWQATLPRAIMLWALLEAAGMAIGVLGLLSGELVVPLVGLPVFLALMFLHSPARIAGE